MSYDFLDKENRQTFTISQLNKQVRLALERTYDQIWVKAEVTDVTIARSGHIYFKMSDPDGKAQIDAVMWRSQAARYSKTITTGSKIKCLGRVTLYELGGRYQFVAQQAQEDGEGEKARAFEKLKKQLENEGLFSETRKRKLPAVPNCVGIVTSRSGAALRDIIKVMSRRFPARLLLAHAQVQGKKAPYEIAAAIELLEKNNDVEVIIVGRGGGSAEDLDGFNSEKVARAIAKSRVPVISAVGHEIDISLCDLVADKRAATPSEAAEFAVPEMEILKSKLDDIHYRLVFSIKRICEKKLETIIKTGATLRTHDPRVRLRRGAESLAELREILARWPVETMSQAKQKFDGLFMRLINWPQLAISHAKGELMMAGEGVYRWPKLAMTQYRGDFGKRLAQLDALSPLKSLARGYSVVKSEDGKIIKEAKQNLAGTKINVTMAKGSLEAKVTKIIEE